MNTAIQDQLVSFVLAVLAASAAQGLPREGLLREARLQVWRELSDPDLGSVLRALADKQLVVETTPVVGPTRWRITDHGRSVAQEKGLA